MNLIRYSFIFYIIGAIPIPIIFLMHNFYPTNEITNTLFLISNGHARIISESFFEVSTILSTWCLFAPLLPLIMFVVFQRKLQLNYIENNNAKKLYKGLPSLVALLVIEVGFFYFGKQNLSTSWDLLQKVSENQILLCFYFLISYLAYFFISWLPALYGSFLYQALTVGNKK